MSRRIIILTEDNRAFSVAVEEIARSRAAYYANIDKTITFQEEYDYTISSPQEITEWLSNNMNWYECYSLVEEDVYKYKPKKALHLLEYEYFME